MAAHPRHHRRSFCAVLDPFSQKRRRQIFLHRIPGRINRLFAVKRILSGNALAPAFRAVSMHGQEQDAALRGATKAGFKEMHQRHMNLAQSNGFNFHCCSLTALLTNPHPPTRTTSFHPIGREEKRHCLPRHVHSPARPIPVPGQRETARGFFSEPPRPARDRHPTPSRHKFVRVLRSASLLESAAAGLYRANSQRAVTSATTPPPGGRWAARPAAAMTNIHSD